MRNPRVFYNAWYLQRKGVTLGGRAWISGKIDLALGGDSSLSVGKDIFIPRMVEIRGSDRGRIMIGDGVTIDSGARLSVANDATLLIGDRVGIGPYNFLNAFGDLTVGDDTMFGPFVNVNCADHGMERGRPMREQYGTYGPVRIGKDCWLGAMVVVLKGATIGDGAVIGAGSVVAGDIPEYAIAAGSPARVLRTR
jgi:acetyltransferase-like isoleucine patch superfamily enzyme